MSADSISSSFDTERRYQTQQFKVAVVQKSFEHKMQTIQAINAFANSANPAKAVDIIT